MLASLPSTDDVIVAVLVSNINRDTAARIDPNRSVEDSRIFPPDRWRPLLAAAAATMAMVLAVSAGIGSAGTLCFLCRFGGKDSTCIIRGRN